QKLTPRVLGSLDQSLYESSGLAKADSVFLWTMNDDGNAAVIYLINQRGENIFSFRDSLLHNHDWEDLAEDSVHFFIGDFGNNNNQKRKDLLIYILNHNGKEISSPIRQITFHYPDQKQFPPPP